MLAERKAGSAILTFDFVKIVIIDASHDKAGVVAMAFPARLRLENLLYLRKRLKHGALRFAFDFEN